MASKFDTIIFISFVAIILGFFVAVTSNVEECIEYQQIMTEDGFVVHACRTGSMCNIDYSGYMACTPQTIDELEVGDIVFFKKFEAIAGNLHRIIDISGNQITTKGDCNDIADHPIPFENVVWVLRENCD